MGEELTEQSISKINENEINEFKLLKVDSKNGPWLRNTLSVDKCKNRDDALVDIQKVLRPGEPALP